MKNRYRFCFFWFKPKENSPSAASRGKGEPGGHAYLKDFSSIGAPVERYGRNDGTMEGMYQERPVLQPALRFGKLGFKNILINWP